MNTIRQRLSLREPLAEALEVVAKLADKLALKKPAAEDDYEAYLNEQLLLAQEVCPFCKNFERDFPSFAFSIATGIGKTRLMGACIAYLYLKKGIRHFFILAPNLTLYEKLIRDFGEPSYEKYVFKGIAEFVHNKPVVITGENYNSAHGLFSNHEIQINIFNIAKFNSENRGGAPRMRRLAECIGQSYFDYLASLDDLVILMDEAHRYHADASKKAINELRPILGLEMTATPTDEKGKSFKNIVYEYNLAQALEDGKYVKVPTVARRRNFQKGNLSNEELDMLKIEDAINIHERTKVHLELYARDPHEKRKKRGCLRPVRQPRFACDPLGVFPRDGQRLLPHDAFAAREAGDAGAVDDVGAMDAQEAPFVQGRLPLRDRGSGTIDRPVDGMDRHLGIVRGDVTDPLFGERDATALRKKVDRLRPFGLADDPAAIDLPFRKGQRRQQKKEEDGVEQQRRELHRPAEAAEVVIDQKEQHILQHEQRRRQPKPVQQALAHRLEQQLRQEQLHEQQPGQEDRSDEQRVAERIAERRKDRRQQQDANRPTEHRHQITHGTKIRFFTDRAATKIGKNTFRQKPESLYEGFRRACAGIPHCKKRPRALPLQQNRFTLLFHFQFAFTR